MTAPISPAELLKGTTPCGCVFRLNRGGNFGDGAGYDISKCAAPDLARRLVEAETLIREIQLAGGWPDDYKGDSEAFGRWNERTSALLSKSARTEPLARTSPDSARREVESASQAGTRADESP